MSRPLKFRAWNKQGKLMHDGLPLYKNRVFVVAGQLRRDHFMVEFDTDEYELMQFTGLKDKNGKEIYEGDVVQVGGHVMDVRWVGAGFWLVKPELSDVELHQNTAKNIEVIGNIYENPELVEEA